MSSDPGDLRVDSWTTLGGVHAGAGSGVRAGGVVDSSIVQHWLVIRFHVLGYSPIMCVAASTSVASLIKP